MEKVVNIPESCWPAPEYSSKLMTGLYEGGDFDAEVTSDGPPQCCYMVPLLGDPSAKQFPLLWDCQSLALGLTV